MAYTVGSIFNVTETSGFLELSVQNNYLYTLQYSNPNFNIVRFNFDGSTLTNKTNILQFSPNQQGTTRIARFVVSGTNIYTELHSPSEIAIYTLTGALTRSPTSTFSITATRGLTYIPSSNQILTVNSSSTTVNNISVYPITIYNVSGSSVSTTFNLPTSEDHITQSTDVSAAGISENVFYDSGENRVYFGYTRIISNTPTRRRGSSYAAYDFNPTTRVFTRNIPEYIEDIAFVNDNIRPVLAGAYNDDKIYFILGTELDSRLRRTNTYGIRTYNRVIVNAAPTVTQPIPDQMLAATTTTELNLPDYIEGTPDPTFSLGAGAPSFVTIDEDTLTISPQISHVRAAVYPIRVIGSNSEGSVNEDFNITVTDAPPRAIASITGTTDAAAETIAFTITWTNVTDYAGFDATDITPTVSSSTRQASGLSARSNNSYVYTIYPTADTNGTANITIAANVFTTPPAGGNNVLITSPTISYSFAPVPAGSKYKYTIPLPTNESGTLHVTMRERSVTADSVAGPGTQSYLGSFEYDTTIRPELVRIDRPNQLQVGDNDVILDWNVEVEGVAADQFYLEGITGIDTTNITLFSTATPDPDTSPDASARTTPIAADTRAKYYLLRINIPDGTTITGNLDVYIVGDGINNDY